MEFRNRFITSIRSPNGTLDPVIWQNNVNTFIKMLLYCKSDRFDMDTILRREREIVLSDDISEYNKIYLEQAIEFADLIFDNNLDKLYF